jgi:hypothetical protein
MEDKITIIEGPTPNFDQAPDAWAMGIFEGPVQHDLVFTRLRTYNGPALVERCYRAWRTQSKIVLEYRDPLGMTQSKPIIAIRSVDSEDGQVLLMWLRMEHQEGEEEQPPELDLGDNGDQE